MVLALAIKTSIRSDRMYQFLFEANAWKFVWHRAFRIEPSRFYCVVTGTYGTNPDKLNSVDFSSVSKKQGASKAIDGMTKLTSPFDLIDWFTGVIQSLPR